MIRLLFCLLFKKKLPSGLQFIFGFDRAIIREEFRLFKFTLPQIGIAVFQRVTKKGK